MRKITLLLLSAAAIAVVAFQSNVLAQVQHISISGRVVDADGKGLPGLHVYAVKGEEEAFTNEQGYFTLRSWQKAPLLLVVQQDAYTKQRFRISQPQQKQLIRFVVR